MYIEIIKTLKTAIINDDNTILWHSDDRKSTWENIA